MPSWLETAMMVFFCGNTYKNTLQNVTANRGIFFDHLKGGDGNQRENPHHDLFPVPPGKKAASSKGTKAVRCLRPTFSSKFQPGETLQGLRRHRPPQTENFKRPEKTGHLRTIRGEKTLILRALSAPVNGIEVK